MKRIFSFTSIIILSILLFSYTLQVKPVSANTENAKVVKLGGEAFGIRMFSDGVIVIEVEKSIPGSEEPSPAVIAGIEVNDIIKKVNGKTLRCNEDFTNMISQSNGNPLDLLIERNDKLLETELIPQNDSQGILRAGIWIKDSAAGIGTITYYDTSNSTFGALGHGICESGTGTLIPVLYGEIATAEINDITKSKNGNVGSLNGYFNEDSTGEVYCNSDCGIFGKYIAEPESKTITVAEKEDVKIGDAEIYCTVNNNVKRAYDVRIKRLSNHGQDMMVIEIIDQELLALTGGIVQGMSGSPIVQNGKLVGAITHVLVNNVKCGYGIYIEDMLEKSI